MRWTVAILLLPLAGCFGGSGGGIFGTEPYVPTAWPDASDATLRPGAQLYFFSGQTGSQCTAGFMFRSADNGTLYLSSTAHCIADLGLNVGDAVYSNNRGTRIGTIAYDGWADGDQSIAKDAMLVAIDNTRDARGNAHPAVIHWSGPTGLAAYEQQAPGTEVVAYGNSGQRSAGVAMTGNLLASPPSIPGDFTGLSGATYADMDPHPIGGDSGGPLLTQDGRALGLLHGGISLSGPLPAETDVYTPLSPQIDRFRAAGGDLAGVRLVTWN